MQTFRPKHKKHSKKKKNGKRRFALATARQCPLCLKESSTLYLHRVCPCVLDSGAYKTILISGKEHRMVDAAKLSTYRESYIELINKKPDAAEPEVKELVRRIRIKQEPTPKQPSRTARQEFYNSQEWKAIRFDVLRDLGAKCCLCGATKETSIMHVDHIVPLSKDWSLRLKKSNLQVLCIDCNMGKSNRDSTDFRDKPLLDAQA